MENNQLKLALEYIRLNTDKINIINISMVRQNVENTSELNIK